MKNLSSRILHLSRSLSLGWFLAYRQLRRSSFATTALIVFVMTLTFLNLVVVRGVLVGLLQGATNNYKAHYAGDIVLTKLPKKSYIENSPYIIETIKSLPGVETYTYRYTEGGTVEAGYKNRLRETDDPNSAAVSIVGIDPVREDAAMDISRFIVEGRFLTPEDTEGIVLGANMLKKYLDIESPNISLLENVEIGDRVRVNVGSEQKEFTVIGILKSKTDEIDFRAFMLESTMRQLIGRGDYNVDEISVVLEPGTDPYFTKEMLVRSGADQYARVQTWQESLPKFLLDIQNTFALLGNAIGSIGLVVASITIFIVIFINAITRRKYIGILKGIGINATAIEFAYVIQSLFYAALGIIIGMGLLYGFMVPFVNAHPIKFPFSDGILVAELSSTLIRAALLMIATLIAGYIPARMVVKQNTLDAILGRK
jgi:putative ABC transport system permease protein